MLYCPMNPHRSKFQKILYASEQSIKIIKKTKKKQRNFPISAEYNRKKSEGLISY